MAKKKRRSISNIDFETGIGEIIPSTQESFSGDEFSGVVRKEEKQRLVQFKQILGSKIDQSLKAYSQFPSDNEVFVFVVQYFISEKQYSRRDIDNMAKTILDVLKERIYRDDSQVKTLLVTKKMESRIKQNFAYVSIKEIKGGRDVDALKISGLERSVILYNELKKRGVV